jgi:hypothetical protein
VPQIKCQVRVAADRVTRALVGMQAQSKAIVSLARAGVSCQSRHRRQQLCLFYLALSRAGSQPEHII